MRAALSRLRVVEAKKLAAELAAGKYFQSTRLPKLCTDYLVLRGRHSSPFRQAHHKKKKRAVIMSEYISKLDDS